MDLRLRSRARRCAAFKRKGFMVRGAICGDEAPDIAKGTAASCALVESPMGFRGRPAETVELNGG